ncbi:hypothetical protein B0I26_11412 [Anoxybacillus vitaminiphilus]|uniref:Uncharacterized protein n=1 Tax=Paranoxybacillus vitaminiphilus TaxID=581036 RepID=A0A327Y794_9BACL|nr:hypothetical protein [Anoxybacillus vitaminiphilus]RAK17008.1 hypothetical protein B0I26_11412 [Anoxybacillus vitaminiphilus]
MLTVSISYHAKKDLHEIFSLLQGTATDNGWKVSLKDRKNDVYIVHEKSKQQLIFSFANHLSFEQYQQIHRLITSIQHYIEGTVDDSNSLLGYLADGRGAYIVTNWNEWAHFIMSAKLKSLEGRKVSVYDDKETELASGLLLDYKLDEAGCIYECTLITSFGERTFRNQHLHIESTNEW